VTETIRYSPIYVQDLKLGTGTGQVQLADGRVVTLDQISLDLLAHLLAATSSSRPYKVLATQFYAMAGYGTLSDALTAIGSDTRTLLILVPTTISSTTTLPANVTLWVTGAGSFSVSSGATLTINGPMLFPTRQIFSGSGSVRIAHPTTVFAEWWGAVADGSTDCQAALQAASDAMTNGGTLEGLQGTYNVSGEVTFKSNVIVVGQGMDVTEYTNTGSANLFRFTDTSTSNDELRYGQIRHVHLSGNSSSGKGLVVDNPLHFTASHLLVDEHGGIGMDFRKGVNSSTFGQNIWVDHCWVQLNRGGGIRLSHISDTAGHDIAHISNCSINQNGYYGIYLNRQTMITVEDCEIGAYYYGSLLGGHQAVPVAINGGVAVNLKNISFENNGGNGATPNYQIRTGWDGDAQVNDDNSTQGLLINNCDFKAVLGQADGALTHVLIRNVRAVTFWANAFEKSPTYPHTVNGVEFSSDTLSNGGYVFLQNFWHALDAKVTGGANIRPMLWTDVYYDEITGDATPGYGYITDNVDQKVVWNRFFNQSFDNFQILSNGHIKRGAGSAAPAVGILFGSGTPEGNVTAAVGSLYQRTDGGAGTSLYVKESGSGNTGWVAK
jgi:hypothetical protein